MSSDVRVAVVERRRPQGSIVPMAGQGEASVSVPPSLLLLLLLVLSRCHTGLVQQPRSIVLSYPDPAGGRTASYAAAGSPLANTRLSAH